MRVLMIDDHVMFLQGLRTLFGLLAPHLDIETSAHLSSALAMAAAGAYDLVLLDWHMGECDGAESMARLREAGCAARIVILSGETDATLIRRALDAGAAGFIPKIYSSEVMLAALDVVIKGGIFLPPEALRASSALAATHTPPADLIDVESRHPELTPRQVEVYRAAARGLPNKLIARELGIEVSTVKTHLTQIYLVLGVSNRTQAAYQASSEGFRVD
jgi:DNA-binding NarL/FixJ family response regulator